MTYSTANSAMKQLAALKRNYVFLFFCITFVGACLETGYYFLVPYLRGMGVNLGHWGGLIMGICYGMSFFTRPLVPFFERFAGLGGVLRTGFIFHLIGSAGIAFFADTPQMAILWRSCSGVGLSTIGVSLMGYQTRLIPENVRGRSLALITTAHSIPAFAIVPGLEYLVKTGHFTPYALFFPVVTIMGFGAVLCLPMIKREPVDKKTSGTVSYRKLMARRDVWVFMGSVILFALTDAGQLTFVLLADDIGVPASWFFSSSAALSLLFRLTCGKMLDILPRKTCSAGTAGITALAMILISFSNTGLQVATGGILYGIGMGFGFPALMCMPMDLGGKEYATRLAVVFGILYSGAFFLTPMMMEGINAITGSITATYRAVFAVILILSAATCAAGVKVYKT